jgi:hypothetical protein
VNRLVYFEAFPEIVQAISREKQLKAGPRKAKIALIEQQNAGWLDLSDEWFDALPSEPLRTALARRDDPAGLPRHAACGSQ